MPDAIFLSASVPVEGNDYYLSADPYLIQVAVREFLVMVLGRRLVVWGGHPAITPMVWAVCEDLGVEYGAAVKLYQSRYFEEQFPLENNRFRNVRYVEAVAGSRQSSLQELRQAMFRENEFSAAVFIGGMEGCLAEYEMFVDRFPGKTVLPLPQPGGAAREVAKRAPKTHLQLDTLDFSRLYSRGLAISPSDKRSPNLL